MFLDVIEKLMRERNINKNVLANESGIPYTTIDGWWKKGYDNIRLTTLKKLAAYFNVSLDYLMDAPSAEEEYENMLQYLKVRPEMKLLFSASKTATREDIENAAKFLEAIKK
ncbi:MAG: helix-turn-helix transcriptional regulator [Eubacteriales bacterium]